MGLKLQTSSLPSRLSDRPHLAGGRLCVRSQGHSSSAMEKLSIRFVDNNAEL